MVTTSAGRLPQTKTIPLFLLKTNSIGHVFNKRQLHDCGALFKRIRTFTLKSEIKEPVAKLWMYSLIRFASETKEKPPRQWVQELRTSVLDWRNFTGVIGVVTSTCSKENWSAQDYKDLGNKFANQFALKVFFCSGIDVMWLTSVIDVISNACWKKNLVAFSRWFLSRFAN